jgi:hypothetical protein
LDDMFVGSKMWEKCPCPSILLYPTLFLSIPI